MRARVVVFPIRGRSWCFSRSLDSSSSSSSSSSAAAAMHSSSPPPSWRDLWRRMASSPGRQNAEILVDFLADKMNRAWVGLERAPPGTIKSRIHSLGLRLLSRVKPSEIFLRSLTKEVTGVEITYPASLNPRLVRRRLRHVAMRGLALHRKYLYGSVSLLPITTAFSVLPLPNIPFFWIVFRAYSNWRALQGSQRLLLLVSDDSSLSSVLSSKKRNESIGGANHELNSQHKSPLVLKPSEDLERLLVDEDVEGGVSADTVASICKAYDLDKMAVLKYRNSL